MQTASPTVADWISAFAAGAAAIGTVGALFAALWQIREERDERKAAAARQDEASRRAQAEKISAWVASFAEGSTPVAMLNQSESPVYGVIISLVMVQGAGPRRGEDLHPVMDSTFRACVSLLPPGKSYVRVGGGWAGMSRRPGIEVAFTDSRGQHWQRLADGTLLAVDQSPTKLYGLVPPISWQVPSTSLEPS